MVLSSEIVEPEAVLLVPAEMVTACASPPICGTAATAALESNPSASVDIALIWTDILSAPKCLPHLKAEVSRSTEPTTAIAAQKAGASPSGCARNAINLCA